MLCDFTAGLEVVSFLNLIPIAAGDDPRHSPPTHVPIGSEAHVGIPSPMLNTDREIPGRFLKTIPGHTRPPPPTFLGHGDSPPPGLEGSPPRHPGGPSGPGGPGGPGHRIRAH